MYEAEIALLTDLVTEHRRSRMDAVLRERTRYVTAVVEDVYQPHNASAVLRSCDSFGIQDVHIVEARNEYRVNPSIELGTAQWLSLSRHRSIEQCTEELRGSGYRIVATTPHGSTTSLPDFDLAAGPVALLFGTEMEGLSDAALDMADEYLEIPMVGFVESLNISVSAAVILYTLTRSLRASSVPWTLPERERDALLFAWLKGSVKEADEHLRRAGL